MTTAETSRPDVLRAYDVCEQITREHARNFSYGIRLLPVDKRRALSAVYATARRIDDLGDGDLPGPDKLAGLEAVRTSLADLDRVEHDEVLVALRDVQDRFPVPMSAFGELVDGCRADVSVHRYATFDELLGYCRCVAGSVGRLSLGIYQPAGLAAGGDRAAVEAAAEDSDDTWVLADSLGVALQLTNILRDVREDRLIGRIYLPAEDLERFGCTLDVDAGGRLADPPDRFAALVRYQAERAERWYQRGLRLLPRLDRRSAACTAAMAGIYHRLLGRIAADPDLIRAGRLSLPATTKLGVAARALMWGTA
ncbi:MAG TPA: squalene/phytoene synthase family protein [Nocardioidaceae bacterium]|nr:squalene/phytoene synthase family protein [Nocardioidaceae bacterium]